MESQEQIRVVNLSEADVSRVHAELQSSPEASVESAATQEQVRQALVAVLPQPVPAAAANATPSQVTESAGTQQRIDSLLQLAAADGIDAAHNRAANEEPYVLDAFHDALAGAFYEQLRQQGKL